MEHTSSSTTTLKELNMNNNTDRVLGRILAVEETNAVAGGWTLASAGDTAKSTDTGAYVVDTTNAFLDIIISPASGGSGR
jgi:hypothetical protein